MTTLRTPRTYDHRIRETICETSDPGTVVTDSGTENVNGNVDALFDHEGWRRVLAQVEVSFSNSMIEAFWRSLRHGWLYLHNLDNTATLRRLIEFY
jgi:putative transposase